MIELLQREPAMTHVNTKNRGALKKLLTDDWAIRCLEERRSDRDKRTSNDTSYPSKGSQERRKIKERRQVEERRDGWLRIGKWRSISVFDE